MVKTVKLSDESYAALEELREKRETMDKAFQRMLRVFRSYQEVAEALGTGQPSHRSPSQPPPGAEGTR